MVTSRACRPFLRAGQADLEQPGAEARLAGDEARAAGGAALLAVPVGEQRAFASRCGRCWASCSPSCPWLYALMFQ